MSTDPQTPRCKCGHEQDFHGRLLGDAGDARTWPCLIPACGCVSWRPAETAR